VARLGGLKAAAYRGRSDLYRWLRKRHVKLVAMGVGEKDGPTWKAVAAAAAKAGQVNPALCSTRHTLEIEACTRQPAVARGALG
jgi:hypothetical protein